MSWWTGCCKKGELLELAWEASSDVVFLRLPIRCRIDLSMLVWKKDHQPLCAIMGVGSLSQWGLNFQSVAKSMDMLSESNCLPQIIARLPVIVNICIVAMCWTLSVACEMTEYDRYALLWKYFHWAPFPFQPPSWIRGLDLKALALHHCNRSQLVQILH